MDKQKHNLKAGVWGKKTKKSREMSAGDACSVGKGPKGQACSLLPSLEPSVAVVSWPLNPVNSSVEVTGGFGLMKDGTTLQDPRECGSRGVHSTFREGDLQFINPTESSSEAGSPRLPGHFLPYLQT